MVLFTGVLSAAAVRGAELVHAAAFGFDPADATRALQAALDSGARTVLVENAGSPWIVEPIRLASDQTVCFASGVVMQAKRGAFRGRGDSLFTASACRNLALIGTGAVFRMWKEDYASTNYTPAEWRHTLCLRGCTNVLVEGLLLSRSGGDGIYVGAAPGGGPCRDVVVRGVVCDENHRQGISVITAENLLIEDTVLRRTGGTAPMAGIDFEPNRPGERLVNCVMRRCVSEENAGGGFLFALHQLAGTSTPVSIRLEDCRSTGDRQAGISWNARNDVVSGATRGTGEFIRCVIVRSGGPGLVVRGQSATTGLLRVVGGEISGTGGDGADLAPVEFVARPDAASDVGGIEFDGLVIREPRTAALLGARDWLAARRLAGVRGTLMTISQGREARFVLDRATLARWIPWTALPDLPRIDLRNAAFEPATERPPGPCGDRAWWRGPCAFVVWAREGDEVVLFFRPRRIGDGPTSAMVRVRSPQGEVMRETKAIAGADVEVRWRAGATGAYRVECDPGTSAVRVRAATHRLCAVGSSGPVALIGTTGDFFFEVPRETPAFAVAVTGGGGTERVRAELVDPSGSVVVTKDNIGSLHPLLVGNSRVSTNAVWRLRLARPSEGAFEDVRVELLGIPPLLADDPASLLRPCASAAL